MDDTFSFGFWGKSSEELLHSKFPMHRACRDGDVKALSDLLLSSAEDQQDLFAEDQFYGWTPAHWAAYYGKLECLQKLVLAGISFDVATERFNQTPTHIAAFGKQPQCLLWLLQNGTAVNGRDYLGETAMHKAARSGSIECLNLLQTFGAIPSVPNNNGQTAMDLAVTCGHQQCAEYLQQTVNGGVPDGHHLTNGHATTGQVNGHEVNGQTDMDMSQNCSNGFLSRKRTLMDLENNDSKKARTDDNLNAGLSVEGAAHSEEEELMDDDSLMTKVNVNAMNHVHSRPITIQYVPTPLQFTPNHATQPAQPNLANGSIPHTNTNGIHASLDVNCNSETNDMQVDAAEPMVENESHFMNGVDAVSSSSSPEKRSSPMSSMLEHQRSVEQAAGYDSIMYEALYGGTPFCHAY